jgi:hypothetical protein
LGNASALVDELMPLFVSKIWGQQTKNQEGTVQLTGNTYLNGKREDLFWDAYAMPSSSFQALFMKWNELAQPAAIVLVGRDKVVKQFLIRLTKTVILWLSNDQDFWEVIEENSASLSPFGLQQSILDMHFVSQIAKCECYSSRHINQSVSSIITHAIKEFATRGIDPNSALPEDDGLLILLMQLLASGRDFLYFRQWLEHHFSNCQHNINNLPANWDNQATISKFSFPLIYCLVCFRRQFTGVMQYCNYFLFLESRVRARIF